MNVHISSYIYTYIQYYICKRIISYEYMNIKVYKITHGYNMYVQVQVHMYVLYYSTALTLYSSLIYCMLYRSTCTVVSYEFCTCTVQ